MPAMPSPSAASSPSGPLDLAVVGGGAAGLMAAIQAGREARKSRTPLRIAVLEGARKPGAKILVSGGGRCNVTHHAVDASAFAGSSPRAIAKVLREFTASETVRFFENLGVPLKREETGKLFPTTDRARTVLDALLAACRTAGAELRHPCRVASIHRDPAGFRLEPEGGNEAGRDAVLARRVILATGGKSLPKSGSDGHGYALARSLGHTLTPHLLPGLVPLLLPEGHFLRALSGVSFPARVTLRGPTGKPGVRFTGPVLCTHFGLSGPAVMDVSRHLLLARTEAPGSTLQLDFLPGRSREELDGGLRRLGSRTPGRWLRELLPDRLAGALLEAVAVDPACPGHQLPRETRRTLVEALLGTPLPVTGHRGLNFAEVTAGGVPLAELRLDAMESRPCPGLHLCGEILDVDGRIGGFNFQWAWASGTVAGRGAVRRLEASG